MFLDWRLCLAFLLATTLIQSQGASIVDNDDAESYNEEFAKMFANMASTAYCHDLNQVYDWSCESCKASGAPVQPGKVKVIDAGAENATRIVVGKLKSKLGCFMVFRGSSNMMNWLRNLEYWEVVPAAFHGCHGHKDKSNETVKCEVHGGFYKIWKNVEDDILHALSELECSKDNGQLYITGHSLGAALSHLAMFSLDAAGYDIAKTYTFEAPRVGNTAFAQEFVKRFSWKFPVYRITHYMDPVVHVPPRMIGFQHVDREVWYDKDGKYKVCELCGDVHGPWCPRDCANQFSNIPDMLLYHRHEHCHNDALLPGYGFCNPPGCRANDPNGEVDPSDVIV